MAFLIFFALLLLVAYGVRRHAAYFNERDKRAGFRPPRGDHRTAFQRLAPWRD